MVNFMPVRVEGLLLKKRLEKKQVVTAGRVGLSTNDANYVSGTTFAISSHVDCLWEERPTPR
jgi:hypothetical protein